MNVECSLEGEPTGGKIVEEISFSPEEVFVRGTREKVDSVQSVIFIIDVSGAEGTLSKSIRLEPVDSKRNPVQGVTVSPEEVEVTVSLTFPQKDVPVEVVLADNVQDEVEIMLLEPSQVTIEGPGYLLKEIDTIKTAEIQLEDVGLPSTVEAPLIFPEEVKPVQHRFAKVRIFPVE